jgi:hypothetical protein
MLAATAPSCSGFTIDQICGIMGRMPALTRRQQKITLSEMRSSGVRGILNLLCGLYLQPLDRDQRGRTARSYLAFRSGIAVCLRSLRQEGRRRAAGPSRSGRWWCPPLMPWSARVDDRGIGRGAESHVCGHQRERHRHNVRCPPILPRLAPFGQDDDFRHPVLLSRVA